MIWTNFKRVVRGGFINFFRNAFVSLASVLVMTVTLFTIAGVLFLTATLTSSLQSIEEKVDINVYFQTDAEEDDILALADSLRKLPEVKEVTYTSRSEALENFKVRHANDELTLQALSELPDNPLGAVLNIRAKDPSQYEGISEFLKSDNALAENNRDIIDEINYYDNKTAIDKLTKIIDSARALGIGIALILVVVSLVIAFNTIRLAIFISREEISVMRLVGASNKYIRWPFVITGVLYGAVAGIITLAIYFPLTYYVGGATEDFFSGLNLFTYYKENIGLFIVLILGSGIVLGAVSSFLAVRRYLHI